MNHPIQLSSRKYVGSHGGFVTISGTSLPLSLPTEGVNHKDGVARVPSILFYWTVKYAMLLAVGLFLSGLGFGRR
jgi:hypothetical protein